MKQNPKSDFQRCTTLIQCRYTALNNVKSTLHSANETVFQRCTMSYQCCFNVDKLSQGCFSVASMSVKAIAKPIWLTKSMDLHIIDKF